MNSAKLFSTAVLACLFMVACAKSNTEEAARIANGSPNSSDSTILEDRAGNGPALKIDLTKESYEGETVTLVANKDNKDNVGYISFSGKDAQAIYDRLRIKEAPGIDGEATGKLAKSGKNLTCLMVSGTADSAECSFKIDYSSGTVTTSREVTIDEQAKEITETFQGGQKISILGGNTALLSISGTDAEALFIGLKAEEKALAIQDSWMKITEKVGTNVKCSTHSTTDGRAEKTYSCFVRISTTDGEIKEAISGDIGSQKKTEEKKEETTTEEAPAETGSEAGLSA